jgi:hypothetical protein
MADKKVVVTDDSVKATDDNGNSVTLGKRHTTQKDLDAGKVNVKKTQEDKGKKATTKDETWTVGFTENGGSSTWGFNSGGAYIEVHCPTDREIKDDPNKKPTIKVAYVNPKMEVTDNLKDSKEQDAIKDKLKKMFGEHK